MSNEKRMYGLSYDKIYYSDNYGPYIILDTYKRGIYNKWRPTALIKFTSTNYEKIVDADDALYGKVTDNSTNIKIPIDTNLLSELDKLNRLNRFAKNIWESMIRRCYNDKANSFKMYGELGVTVCERWLLFDNFLVDLPFIPQYDKWSRFPTIYQLDKDYLQLHKPKNERIYSLETCMFLHYLDNNNLRSIEFKNNNSTESNYYGIHIDKNGKYGVQIKIEGNTLWYGTFNNEIIAASVFNYHQERFHRYELVPLLNDVPYIPPNEFIKYNTNPKTMCTIVNNEKE